MIIYLLLRRSRWLVVVEGKHTDEGGQSLFAPLLLAMLYFEVDIVEIADAVVVCFFLFAQLGHFVHFGIVHSLQHILSRLGTQIPDLDLIGFEALSWHPRKLLDFLEDGEDVLNIAIQEIERLVDWESHGRLTLLSATLAVAARAPEKDGWEVKQKPFNRTVKPDAGRIAPSFASQVQEGISEVAASERQTEWVSDQNGRGSARRWVAPDVQKH